jgi:hypothetical protein
MKFSKYRAYRFRHPVLIHFLTKARKKPPESAAGRLYEPLRLSAFGVMNNFGRRRHVQGVYTSHFQCQIDLLHRANKAVLGWVWIIGG